MKAREEVERRRGCPEKARTEKSEIKIGGNRDQKQKDQIKQVGNSK